MEFVDSDARPYSVSDPLIHTRTGGNAKNKVFALGIVLSDGLICPEGKAFYYRNCLVKPGTRVSIVWVRFERVQLVPWWAFYYCVDNPEWHRGCSMEGIMHYQPEDIWHEFSMQTRGSNFLRPFAFPALRFRRFWTRREHSQYSFSRDLFRIPKGWR